MKEDGGAAFPVAESLNQSGSRGMTLRDWFAGKIMSGWAASGWVSVSHHNSHEWEQRAACSYLIADAMLEARKS